MDLPVWFDDWAQAAMDALGVGGWDEPLPPSDEWFVMVEPVTPEEPEWMVVERASLYDGVVGG